MAQAMTNGKSNAKVSDLTDQIDTLRKDLSELTKLIGEVGKAKSNELAEAAKDQVEMAQVVASETVDQVKTHANDKVDQVKTQATELNAQANEFIAKQPAAALGIAAGLGFLVGFMSSRK